MPRPMMEGEAARTPFGIELAVGVGVIVVSVAVAALLFSDAPARLSVVALAVGGFTAVADDIRAGLAAGGLGYLLFDGFLLNRYGELTWDGTTSMWYLSAFALALMLGFGGRWVRRFRDHAAIDAALGDLLNNTVSMTEETYGDRFGVRAADGGPLRGAHLGGAGGGAAVSTPLRRPLRHGDRGEAG